MNTTVITCVAFLGTFILYPVSTLIASLFFPSAASSAASFFRRRIVNPQVGLNLPIKLFRRPRTVKVLGQDVVTPLFLITMAVISILHVAALTVDIKKSRLIRISRENLIKRSGTLLAFDFSFLCSGARQTLMSDRFAIPLQFQLFLHRWLGRIVFLDAVVHAIVAFVHPGSKLSPTSQIGGYTAAFAILGLVTLSIPFIRQAAYEFFSITHGFLAIVVVVATFLHLDPIGVSKPSAIILVSTASTCILMVILRVVIVIMGKADATIYQQCNEISRVELKLKRSIRVTAGQHIWLRIPSKGGIRFANWLCLPSEYTGFLESHPFVVSSWEKEKDGLASKIILLIERKNGFTKRLTSSSKEPQELSAYLEGPYGRPIRAENFGTVILYATGIGIAAQLAVVKQLLESRSAGQAKTQRITLLWEVEAGSKTYETASQMVTDLLEEDWLRLRDSMHPDWLALKERLQPNDGLTFSSAWKGADPDQGYIFRCTKYVKISETRDDSNLPPSYMTEEFGRSGSLVIRSGPGINLELAMDEELRDTNIKGDTLISVCAYPDMANTIRKIAAQKGLHLHEHAFRPEE